MGMYLFNTITKRCVGMGNTKSGIEVGFQKRGEKLEKVTQRLELYYISYVLFLILDGG